MKRLAPNLASRGKAGKQGEPIKKAGEAVKAAIKAYEDKFGVVKIE